MLPAAVGAAARHSTAPRCSLARTCTLCRCRAESSCALSRQCLALCGRSCDARRFHGSGGRAVLGCLWWFRARPRVHVMLAPAWCAGCCCLSPLAGHFRSAWCWCNSQQASKPASLVLAPVLGIGSGGGEGRHREVWAAQPALQLNSTVGWFPIARAATGQHASTFLCSMPGCGASTRHVAPSVPRPLSFVVNPPGTAPFQTAA